MSSRRGLRIAAAVDSPASLVVRPAITGKDYVFRSDERRKQGTHEHLALKYRH